MTKQDAIKIAREIGSHMAQQHTGGDFPCFERELKHLDSFTCWSEILDTLGRDAAVSEVHYSWMAHMEEYEEEEL